VSVDPTPPAFDVPPTQGWKPTKKWWSSLVVGAAGIAGSWIVTGAFDDVERGMAATLISALVVSYFKSNDPTPGGVPDATV
jgi:hypothetical protein